MLYEAALDVVCEALAVKLASTLPPEHAHLEEAVGDALSIFLAHNPQIVEALRPLVEP